MDLRSSLVAGRSFSGKQNIILVVCISCNVVYFIKKKWMVVVFSDLERRWSPEMLKVVMVPWRTQVASHLVNPDGL